MIVLVSERVACHIWMEDVVAIRRTAIMVFSNQQC